MTTECATQIVLSPRVKATAWDNSTEFREKVRERARVALKEKGALTMSESGPELVTLPAFVDEDGTEIPETDVYQVTFIGQM